MSCFTFCLTCFCTHLNEVGQQRATELLFEDFPVQLVVIATRNEGREEDIRETRIAEVLERQRTQLLEDGGRLT